MRASGPPRGKRTGRGGHPCTRRAALGPYRATLRNTRPPQRDAGLNELWTQAPILPSLYLHGRDDRCMTPAFAHWTEKVLPAGYVNPAVKK